MTQRQLRDTDLDEHARLDQDKYDDKGDETGDILQTHVVPHALLVLDLADVAGIHDTGGLRRYGGKGAQGHQAVRNCGAQAGITEDCKDIGADGIQTAGGGGSAEAHDGNHQAAANDVGKRTDGGHDEGITDAGL